MGVEGQHSHATVLCCRMLPNNNPKVDILTIIFRILHIFAGVAWVGATWLVVFFVEPTVSALGPDGGKFMNYMATVRRYPIYIASAAGITILAGFILFGIKWGAVWDTPKGLTFLVGGIFGLAAFVVGIMTGGVTGRLMKLGGEIAQQGRPPSPEQAAELRALQERLRTLARVTAILSSIALLGMAIARYV